MLYVHVKQLRSCVHMYMTGTLEALTDRDQIENIPEADLDGFDRNSLSDQIIKELRV